MSKYLQKKFALSEQGGKDLTKAIVCCALTNISLMFPMGILFLFMERLTGPLIGLVPRTWESAGMWESAWFCWRLLASLNICSTTRRFSPPIRRAPI